MSQVKAQHRNYPVPCVMFFFRRRFQLFNLLTLCTLLLSNLIIFFHLNLTHKLWNHISISTDLCFANYIKPITVSKVQCSLLHCSARPYQISQTLWHNSFFSVHIYFSKAKKYCYIVTIYFFSVTALLFIQRNLYICNNKITKICVSQRTHA